MRSIRKLALAAGLALGTGAALAQVQPGQDIRAQQPVANADRQNQHDSGEHIASFVSDTTVAVGKMDLTRVEPKALQAWLVEFVQAAEPDPQRQQIHIQDLNRQLGNVQKWQADMRQAGVERVYALVDSQIAGMATMAVLVPLKPGDDAEAIQRLLTPRDEAGEQAGHTRIGSAVIRDTVVVGSQMIVESLKQPREAHGEALSRAMESVSGSGIQVAFMPTRQMQQTAQAMADDAARNLPEGVDAQEVKRMPEQVRWLALGIDTPPQTSVKLIVQANSPQSAHDLGQTITRLLNSAKDNPRFAGQVGDVERLTRTLRPEVQEDRVVFLLDRQEIDQLVKQDLAQAIRATRGEQPIRAGEIPQDRPEPRHTPQR